MESSSQRPTKRTSSVSPSANNLVTVNLTRIQLFTLFRPHYRVINLLKNANFGSGLPAPCRWKRRFPHVWGGLNLCSIWLVEPTSDVSVLRARMMETDLFLYLKTARNNRFHRFERYCAMAWSCRIRDRRREITWLTSARTWLGSVPNRAGSDGVSELG